MVEMDESPKALSPNASGGNAGFTGKVTVAESLDGGSIKKQSTKNTKKGQVTQKKKNEEEEGQQQPIAKSFFGYQKFQDHACDPAAQQFAEFKIKGCSVCQAQIDESERFLNKQVRKMQYFKGQKLEFQELIKKLIPDVSNPKEAMIKGCQIIMPETVFYKDGKIDLIVSNDRDFCLATETRYKWIDLELRKKLPIILSDRRADNVYLGIQKQATERQQKNQNKGTEKTFAAATKKQAPDFNTKSKEEEKHVPFVLFRYNGSDEDDQNVENKTVPIKQIVTKSQLLDGYLSKVKNFWQSIEYLQTCVKAPSFGIGKQFTVHFFAPLNEKNDQTASELINYDFKSLPDDLSLLEEKKYMENANKQCLKIGYYLQKVRSVEILQMKAEFLVDENCNMWFTYAREIKYRECKDKLTAIEDQDGSKVSQNISAHQAAKKDLLLQELREYEASLQDSGSNVRKENKVTNKMLDFMNGYYVKMKNDLGIDSNFGVESHDPELDAVLLALRPNTTAQNFREFLTKHQNVHKTEKWKKIARDVHDEDKKKELKREKQQTLQAMGTGQSFFSARNQLLQNKKAQQLDALIGALDSGAGGDKSQQFGARKNNQDPYGSYGDQPVAQGTKQVSTLKAELVRNNLVTRNDLMRLYQPPIKRSSLLENNPFFNKSLVKGEDFTLEQKKQALALRAEVQGVIFNANGVTTQQRKSLTANKAERNPTQPNVFRGKPLISA